MEMTPRERVMAALNRQETDRIPFCELTIDRSLAEAIMNWSGSSASTSATTRKNPYTVKEHKAIAQKLGLDNLGSAFTFSLIYSTVCRVSP